MQSASLRNSISNAFFGIHTSNFAESSSHLPREETCEQLPTFEQLFTPTRLTEQQSHFVSIANAVRTKKAKYNFSSLTEAAESISPELLAAEQHRRFIHLICRLGALDPEFSQENLFCKVEEACREQKPIEEICTDLGIRIHPSGERLITKFQYQEREFLSCNIPLEKTRLNTLLRTLDQLLLEEPIEAEQLEETNRAILKILRVLYTSPIYRALNSTANHPLIDILHAIALDQYSNTRLSSAFENLGERLNVVHCPLPERAQIIWNRLSQIGIRDTIISTLRHSSFRVFCTRLLPFFLRKIAQIFSLHRFVPLMGDERATLRNTPGAIIDEIQPTKSLHERKIRTIMLAAPTYEHEATPEFCAALQALENNQFSSTEDAYTMWAYTNLQNLSSIFERPSTNTLMYLQQDYPLSFQAITLNQRTLESPYDTFSEEEVAYQLALIFSGHSTSLENRGRAADAGYYFPTTFLEQYRPGIEHLAHEAFHIIQAQQANHSPSSLKNAYVRLLHLGIARLHEIAAFELAEQRTQIPHSGIRSTICASCVDRGGMMNTAYLHALDQEEEYQFLASGTLFGRALLSHRRSPIHAFLSNLTNLFAIVPRTSVHAFLSAISAGRLTPVS